MNQTASCQSRTAQAAAAGWDPVCGSNHLLYRVSLGALVYIMTVSTAAGHTKVVECVVAPIRALVGRRRRGSRPLGQQLHFRS